MIVVTNIMGFFMNEILDMKFTIQKITKSASRAIDPHQN